MTDLERMIAERLVADILACGYRISVNDGEEITLRYSDNLKEILGALSTTFDDFLIVYETVKQGDGMSFRRLGLVQLVWGNGFDLISDYSTGLEDVVGPVINWVIALEIEPQPPSQNLNVGELVSDLEHVGLKVIVLG